MAAADSLRVDVAILGGGIAGLWLLARLRQAGYSALLLEKNALGAGQTLASQGIIHGGLKYALDLRLGSASDALAEMPTRWRDCLAGKGEIDLGDVPLAAERHLFWARRTLASRITGFFGSKMVRGRVDALDMAHWPAALQDPEHVGAVYALDEMVLDVPALIRALAAPHAQCLKKIASVAHIAQQDGAASISLRCAAGRERSVTASTLVATSGAGNEQVLEHIGQPAELAQRRPLQMVLIGNAPSPLWAHCFDSSDKPRVTVTTHRRKDGSLVWYVGGKLAEVGAGQVEGELIDAARAEFSYLLPRLDMSKCRFATLAVDRAEGATESGAKPDGPVLRRFGQVLVAWPTKLALAPRLADLVLAGLPPPGGGNMPAVPEWAAPDFAEPPWETVAWR